MSRTPIELKSCPFCGGDGEVHPSALGAFTRMAFVKCVECGCQSLASHYDNPAFMPQHIVKAAENWNNRPAELELAEARAEIERLEKAVKVVQSAFKNYKNANAEVAKIEMREAKIVMREAKTLAASCNSDSVNSERAANAILTDEIERKDKLIEQMREALQRVASQRLTEEMDEEERERADGCYEDAYQIIIREARAALSAAERGEGWKK